MWRSPTWGALCESLSPPNQGVAMGQLVEVVVAVAQLVVAVAQLVEVVVAMIQVGEETPGTDSSPV